VNALKRSDALKRSALKRGTRGRDNQPAPEDRGPKNAEVCTKIPFAKPRADWLRKGPRGLAAVTSKLVASASPNMY
jgi:hypothetical protein